MKIKLTVIVITFVAITITPFLLFFDFLSLFLCLSAYLLKEMATGSWKHIRPILKYEWEKSKKLLGLR